ncbi:TetR/AcrR family transcriptional regulator [Nonomuraea jabiensis]|uniref:AcrR family transcriptional regulator n=1 Tax=Nonomuraea jabiensis TaxID=882448 RepID=A0A7W9GB94_9ACTN|nr:TetR/AcrR family transcriptional regulator [Nonomuraea jabiensis]MBB5780518.1 AcrR family transcriptional regulator [Nonomuraea jabiensis]
MSIDEGAPRRGGRTRSPQAHQAVLDAAAELLEEIGYQALTIEKIAERSRVAKSTIYRWWRSRADLVMEAYTQRVAERVPDPDAGGLEDDLTAFLGRLYGIAGYPLRARALQGLMAEAQLDPEFARPFREWVESRRAVVLAMLERARERGEVEPGADLEHMTDLVFGPFWYRLLVGHAPLDPAEARAHAARLLDGVRPGGGQSDGSKGDKGRPHTP